MASLRADSILSLVPRLSLRDIVGSETISSTLEMYDSSCCLASNFLLKASSLFLNFSASKNKLVTCLIWSIQDELTVDHALDLTRGQLSDRVGDGDVGAAARGLLGCGDLEDTVDVDLEDDLKNGVAGFHGRYSA